MEFDKSSNVNLSMSICELQQMSLDNNVNIEKLLREAYLLSIKMNDSIARGNAYDDVKSAGNDICVSIKKYLSITQCGNSGEMIMRDTLSKLITPDMAIYQELERDILGYE